ncbi:hypothetical protein J2Q11_12320 [Tenacibaculum finnmarkense genomovar finnmarkense]|uniref:hypothetical protein n=1 Tax=Tenacibaculum finnmarkense TaxID=2781243 RepID=UPI001EFBAFF8|nr:hypothetical protein [Tenacibaculum finnmarkense]MCG8213590.1 hypothetical protein [Tenacibaculum finnmarkense genomovar finnmarkense]MCG8231915.1 hypothetical protein [Tenacibaculum finnmarkense genomovar finnmarkense]MCG8886471.1 hypothetical protein [Tenacibaculum finnmarkense]MCG8897253.1 hypothetical protein [Tenacibaculum finnmarkense]MCG8903969.1 hypothetical protein [Tenacibaculum finnmarkense]
MSSVVGISLDVIRRFNPSNSDIELLISKLSEMIQPAEVSLEEEMHQESLRIEKLEAWLKTRKNTARISSGV